MMIKKLLATASAVAFTTGSAYALDLTIGDEGAATAAGAAIALASELDFVSSGPLGGDLAILMNTVGTMSGDTDVRVTLTVTGGATFSAALDGTELTDGTDTPSDSVIVSSGGAMGGTSVVYVINPTGAGGGSGEESFGFLLPISFTDCGSAPISVTVGLVTDGGGTPIEGGSAVLAAGGTPDGIANVGEVPTPYLTCADSYSLAIDRDDDALGVLVGSDTILTLASGFMAFAPDGILGDITSTLLPNAVEIVQGGDVFVAGNVGPTVDVVVSFGGPDLDGLDMAATTLGTVAGVVSGLDVTFPVPPADLAGGAVLTLVSLGTVAIDPQTIAVSLSTANLIDAVSGGEDLVDDTAEATGPVDGLELEGRNFGPFDWARDSGGTINHVFRTTGLPTPLPDGSVTIANSSASGGSLDGVYTFTPGAVGGSVSNGEWLINSRQIATDIVGGDFGRADITLTFFTANPTLDVDRAVVSNGVFADFGDCGNDSCSSTASSPDPGEF